MLHPRGLEVKRGTTIYKGKGDPMEYGSYTGIKLLEHAMKVVERIFEHRIPQQIDIVDMELGFMKGKGTTYTNFIIRYMQEKFRAKGKKFCFSFLHFEKIFDMGAREQQDKQCVSWELKNG